MTLPRLLRRAVLLLVVPATCAAATPVEELQQVLRRDPRNVAACTALAGAYVQAARATGDAAWEARADSLVSIALAADSVNADALVLRGTIQLSRHDFAGALATGLCAAPSTSSALAVVADAQIELGRDADALATLQRFVDARPCQAAYARISYYRELHGDRDGAIDAMRRAWDAGGAGAADAAWCAAHVGQLLLGKGDVDGAARCFDRAHALDPRCVLALAGQARVATARGDLAAAIMLYTSANALRPLVENIVALGDLYASAGDARNAERQYRLALILLRTARAQGVVTDVDGAILEADHAPAEDLVARVRAARDRRPSPMADHALSWVLYRAGRIADARGAMTQALRWGTDDAVVLYHAGIIAAAAGDSGDARTLLARALGPSGALSPLVGAAAREALARLEQP